MSANDSSRSRHNCPYCKVEMEQGFIIDRQQHSSFVVQSWAEGVPEPSFWTGLKLKGKVQRKVATWRCPQCGLLSSYAQ